MHLSFSFHTPTSMLRHARYLIIYANTMHGTTTTTTTTTNSLSLTIAIE